MYLFIILTVFTFFNIASFGTEIQMNDACKNIDFFGLSLQERIDSGKWEISSPYKIPYYINPPVSEGKKIFKISATYPTQECRPQNIWLLGTERAMKIVIDLGNYGPDLNRLQERFEITDRYFDHPLYEKINISENYFSFNSFSISLKNKSNKGIDFLKFCYIEKILPQCAIEKISKEFSPYLFNFLKGECFLQELLFYPSYKDLSPQTHAHLLLEHFNSTAQGNFIQKNSTENEIFFDFMGRVFSFVWNKTRSSPIESLINLKELYILLHLNAEIGKILLNTNVPFSTQKLFSTIQQQIIDLEKIIRQYVKPVIFEKRQKWEEYSWKVLPLENTERTI